MRFTLISEIESKISIFCLRINFCTVSENGSKLKRDIIVKLRVDESKHPKFICFSTRVPNIADPEIADRWRPKLSRTLQILDRRFPHRHGPLYSRWWRYHFIIKLIPDELESFRSRWRTEIQKGRESQSPIRQRHGQVDSTSIESRHSEESIDNDVKDKNDKTALDVYENAILKERQGSLSEAVVQYRKAFKVYR